MISEERIEALATKAIDAMEGCTWAAMRQGLIVALRTAAQEAAAEQVRKDAEICRGLGARRAKNCILAQLPPTKTEGK